MTTPHTVFNLVIIPNIFYPIFKENRVIGYIQTKLDAEYRGKFLNAHNQPVLQFIVPYDNNELQERLTFKPLNVPVMVNWNLEIIAEVPGKPREVKRRENMAGFGRKSRKGTRSARKKKSLTRRKSRSRSRPRRSR